MAADGSNGPKPYTQRRASTLFLRVPINDWPAVKRGHKPEFRSTPGKNSVPQFWSVRTPTPVVAYAIRDGRYEKQLMMLEEHWREPVGAISPESLRREGFESLEQFRAYWMRRTGRRFRPLHEVAVFRVRPFIAADVEPAALRLFEHLFGEFVDFDKIPRELLEVA